MHYGVVVPNFSTPERLVDLAVLTERHGFDGFFLWDHVQHDGPPTPHSDTWTTLAAVATRTEHVRLGSWITPLPRRRPQVLARQVVTVDHLSGGRAILGLGLGSQGVGESLGEFARFGEDADPRRRAVLLDEGLQALAGFFSGREFSYEGSLVKVKDAVFLPRPVQERLPIWVACEWPRRAPLRRVAAVGGVCPIKIVNGEYRFMTPEDVSELQTEIGRRRVAVEGFDIAVVPGPPPRATASEFEEAGATWLLMGTDGEPGWEDDIAGLIARGPVVLS
jgi:alkanesulfonate monooxygenase SsuD/methylene tetrahydromethanopterin reductase-like flavin-dependent oxidoreductase (luciferase family)